MADRNDIQNQVDKIVREHSQVELGDKVVDIVTGMCGIVTKRTEVLGGFPQVCLEYPNLTEYDGVSDETWLPVGRVRKVIE